MIIAFFLLATTGCTRDDVAAAVATVAVQLEATLQPWGATVAANAQAVETRIPAALATAKGQLPTATVAPITPTTPHTITPIPPTPPTPSATTLPTTTATATLTATITPDPTETPTNTPTPYPAEVAVHGGMMLLVPGGTFQMGATADSLLEECALFREGCRAEWFIASEPVHAVVLRRYYIDAHEVTNEAYAAFLNATGGDCLDQTCLDVEQSRLLLQEGAYRPIEGAEREPVAGVTWYGAAAFCAWRGARLPTEAEWEKAAAWDPAAAVARRYPWGDAFDGQVVNFCDTSCTEPQAHPDYNDGVAEIAPVMSFEGGRSAYGVYDMAGNLWEWVGDWFDSTYYAQSPDANPFGPAQGNEKVVRGGSWFDTGNFTAAAVRFPSAPDNADGTIGFRCAADVGD